MLIYRTSTFTGIDHTMDLPVTQAQMDEWKSPERRHIQHIFPNLTPGQREFILSGCTEEEWDEIMKDVDDEPQTPEPHRNGNLPF